MDKCILCDNTNIQATIYDTNINTKKEFNWNLCGNHATRMIIHRLTPEEVLIIRELAGGHTVQTNDSYDEFGNINIEY